MNVSNDAWFGDSLALWQRFQVSQALALATGRPLLRATNTGVTGVIGPKGSADALARLGEPRVLEYDVRGYSGTTPYLIWGDGACLAIAVAMVALALRVGSRPPRTK